MLHAEEYFKCDQSLSDYLYPSTLSDPKALETKLRNTDIAQPAIGAASVAMLQSLIFFKAAPQATCGHSYGELVALYAAGWMTADDLWRLSVARGKLMAEAGSSGPGGSEA